MSNPYESPQTASLAPRPPLRRWNACPHCGEAAMTLWKKSRVGPIKTHPCGACDGRVGVTWRWALFSAGIGLLPPAALIAGMMLTMFRVPFDPVFLQGYGWVIVMTVGIVIPALGGVFQTAVLTLLAPLVKR